MLPVGCQIINVAKSSLRTYNDCADEVDTPEVGLAQISCTATESLLSNMVMVQTSRACRLLVSEGVVSYDLLLVMFFFCHDVQLANRQHEESGVDKTWGLSL